jgi:Zn-dependent protease
VSIVDGPWGRGEKQRPSGPPGKRPAGPRPPATPRQQFIWNLISSLLFAGLLAFTMGPIFALGGIAGVFVHEYGHVLAMNRLGCGPARIVIIPFLGGAAIPARAPSTEFHDVVISLAGPVFGLLAMIPFGAAWWWTGNPEWLGGAFFVAFINLLNLAPAPPLDGSKALGPALARIHPNVERGALVAVGGIAVFWAVSRGSWIMAAFLGLSVLGSLRRGAFRPHSKKLSGREFYYSLAMYVAAAVLCVGALSLTLIGLGKPVTPGAVADIFRFG